MSPETFILHVPRTRFSGFYLLDLHLKNTDFLQQTTSTTI